MRGVDYGHDVIDALQQEDEGIRGLLDEYFAEGDHVRRSALGKQLLERCSVQDTVKEEIIHGLLHDLGRKDLADRLDANSAARRRILGSLDEMSAGVTSRDLHLSSSGEFDKTVAQLRDLLGEHLRHEEEEVIPLLRREVPAEELRKMTERLEDARGRAPTRADPDAGPAHATNPVVRKVKAAVSKLRDVPDAPAYHPTSKD